jgi:polyribonucleotide nucleotidyltransferase
VSIADIPLKKAVAGVRVGFIPSQGFIVNPTAAQMSASQLDLMMAGTADAVLMIEGFCDWLSEEQMIQVWLEAKVRQCFSLQVVLCWPGTQHDLHVVFAISATAGGSF